ncbi:unnamed protein product [Cuscuta epithymum]|uniref:Uncharacterized protein n=1 Tax=Cuscuta epithymum TaxID=186058 RepID=A0AAV0FHC1_9ASTE|nr:unnamed protein product [Cuscuta epithymum]
MAVNRAVPGQNKLHHLRPDARLRPEEQHPLPRPQRALAGPQFPTVLGPQPVGVAGASQTGGGRPHPQRRGALPEQAHPLGRQQRDASLRLLRGIAAESKRVLGILQIGAGNRPERHPVLQRFQGRRVLRLPEQRRRVRREDRRVPAQRDPESRDGIGRAFLQFAESGLHQIRSRQIRNPRGPDLDHRSRYEREIRPGETGGASGDGFEGTVLASRRGRNRTLGGDEHRRVVLANVPHRRRLQKHARRRRRR